MYLCDRLSALLGNTFHPLINEEAHQKTFSRQGVCVGGNRLSELPYIILKARNTFKD